MLRSLSFLSPSLLEARGSPSSGQSTKHGAGPGLVLIADSNASLHLLTLNDEDLHKFTISVLNGRGTILGSIEARILECGSVEVLCIMKGRETW